MCDYYGYDVNRRDRVRMMPRWTGNRELSCVLVCPLDMFLKVGLGFR